MRRDRNPGNITSLSILLALGVICLVTVAVALVVNSFRTIRAAAVEACPPSLAEQLVTEDELPDGWRDGGRRSNDAFETGAVGHCGVPFSNNRLVANNVIWQYRTEMDAAEAFKLLKHAFSWRDEVFLPTELERLDRAGDEFLAECAHHRGILMCQIMMRSGVEVVWFQSHIHPQQMSYEGFAHVVEAVISKAEE